MEKLVREFMCHADPLGDKKDWRRTVEMFEGAPIMKEIIEIPVPEEIIDLLGSEEAVRKEAREAFIFDLVRRGKIAKGKSADLLGISLWESADLIAQYQIQWFGYSPEGLEKDLETLHTFKRGKESTS